ATRAPAPVKSYGTWTYYGCTLDNLSSGDGLILSTGASSSMTPQLCMDTCNAYGYALAGLERGNTCYCGNTLASGTVKSINPVCTTTCTGNSALTCGGSSSLDVY
ncbi:WSC-domain-containing protein, partial [Clavulina sp. PMI_390]